MPFNTPLPSRRFLAVGAHALSNKMLELIAKLSLLQHVTVLDCGNRSNMYSVAKLRSEERRVGKECRSRW